ncbi:rhomboid family intramembrane serine protease [Chromobacterium violaceum]|uniref:rhomboid family intramembrane serine protease n=1 Tax=Chromobacterium violaceum TaxID=536 RepID=UPI001B330EA7|nr:rhomboid family intramembrane serine protease [Chromobacterium violaceum]MBP4049943.1 rhomboid family intramembrane serine protease [Chromobacterium violaceum]
MDEIQVPAQRNSMGPARLTFFAHWLTGGLIAVNVAVYVWMSVHGVSWLEPEPRQLVDWGGSMAFLTLTGESWRLFSSMFIHAGAVHLLLNMYMLALIGPLAQKRFGNTGYAIVYLATGLVAAMTSAWWYGRHGVSTNLLQQTVIHVTVSVGASGALMGLAAALCIAGLNDCDMGRSQSKALAQVVIVNLGMGFLTPGVDQACHIGGLLAGLPFGIFYWSARRPRWQAHAWTAGLGALALLAVWRASLAMDSPALRAVSDEIAAEWSMEAAASEIGSEKRERDALAAHERVALPRPVSASEAAGERIDLPFMKTAAGRAQLGAHGRLLYVANTDGNSLDIIDLQQSVRLRRISPPADRCEEEGCRTDVESVAVSPDERWALLPGVSASAVGLVDLAAGKLVHLFKTGERPMKAVFSRDGKRAYVLNGGDDSVSALDVEKRAVIGKSPSLWESDGRLLGKQVEEPVLQWAAGGTQLLLSSGTMGWLRTLDAATLQPVGKLLRLGDERAIAWRDDNHLWLNGPGGLAQYQVRPLFLRQVLKLCGSDELSGWAASPNGKWLAALNLDAPAIRLLSRGSLRTVAILPRTHPVNQLIFLPDGKTLLSLDQWGAIRYSLDRVMDASDYVKQYGEAVCEAHAGLDVMNEAKAQANAARIGGMGLWRGQGGGD